MNFEHYKNFIKIVDAGTISAASKELLIAQPALSNQIKSLEETYGAQLVIRNPRHLELTDAGKILYERIKSICYLEDSAKKEIEACVSGCRGTLRIGCSPANPDPLFYQILLDYHNKYPEVSFEIFERNSYEIIEMLHSGLVDVGLIRAQKHLLPPDILPVMTIPERMMAYFHCNHEFLSPTMEQIPLQCLDGCPISIAHGLVKGFTHACEQEGIKPVFLNISSSRSTSQFWAADKKTVSIVSASVNVNDGDFCTREIVSPYLASQRMLAIKGHQKLSSVAEIFLLFCRNHSLMVPWIQIPENPYKLF